MNLNESVPVAMWRIHMLRLQYLLIACVMGFFVWQQVLFETAPWPPNRIVAKSMLAALALMCLLGLRYPLKMLPLMLLEILWKTVAIVLIILPAWTGGRLTPDQEGLFFECIGILVAYAVMPWGHVWAKYFRAPAEPWRRRSTATASPPVRSRT
ncbi:MAG: hypothetical protein JSR18_00220 [Proteobacteria bacterium]|nr:hypothetical protein [Pseudomonadota bacterium]